MARMPCALEHHDLLSRGLLAQGASMTRELAQLRFGVVLEFDVGGLGAIVPGLCELDAIVLAASLPFTSPLSAVAETPV